MYLKLSLDNVKQLRALVDVMESADNNFRYGKHFSQKVLKYYSARTDVWVSGTRDVLEQALTEVLGKAWGKYIIKNE